VKARAPEGAFECDLCCFSLWMDKPLHTLCMLERKHAAEMRVAVQVLDRTSWTCFECSLWCSLTRCPLRKAHHHQGDEPSVHGTCIMSSRALGFAPRCTAQGHLQASIFNVSSAAGLYISGCIHMLA
jgi:hypothetical protein